MLAHMAEPSLAPTSSMTAPYTWKQATSSDIDFTTGVRADGRYSRRLLKRGSEDARAARAQGIQALRRWY